MAHTTLHFRPATVEDAPELQHLVESAFRAEDSRPKWTADMSLGRNFRLEVQSVINQINKPDNVTLMATGDDGTLIASVEVAKKSSELGYISMLSVDQVYQRGGIGRQVVEFAEGYCQRTWGVKTMGLNALCTREQLILWYERRGYKKTGENTPFRDDLYFVEMKKALI